VTRHSDVDTSALSRGPLEPSPASERARLLTRWSLRMIPATVLSLLMAFIVGNALMHATGTPEGTLLTSKGVAGWISWFVVLVVLLSAPLAGVLLAVVARREGGADRARLALVINAVLAGYLLISSVANLFG